MNDTVPLLEIKDLSLRLPVGGDRSFAVSGASLSVPRGQTVCVVGESGSGKTLLAYSVLQLLSLGISVASGRIEFRGQNLLDYSSADIRRVRGKDIGMVFQEPVSALNPVHRVGRQVADAIRQGSGKRRKVAELFESVELPAVGGFINRYPHELSGGQCQRIMIALALANDPALLIADEPTTALDMTTQKQILTLIQAQQRRRGLGVLFITHDFGVVAEIADHVVVMKSGEVVETGPASQILSRPAHDYTRALIEAVPRPIGSISPKHGKTDRRDVVVVDRLCKSFWPRRHFGFPAQARPAIDNVSFTLCAGETVALVGGSGSGKSTLAQSVIRLLTPDSGEVILEGKQFLSMRGRELRDARRSVQMIFQDPVSSFNPRLTVGEALTRGPVAAGVNAYQADARARRLLRRVGLSERAMKRYPHAFSGGQRQRLAIARALAMEPRLLIADEPTSALDVTVQREILSLLMEFQADDDLAVLFITHDLRLASMISHRTIVLQGGQIIEEGETGLLLRNPREEATRKLVEASPGLSLSNHGNDAMQPVESRARVGSTL